MVARVEGRVVERKRRMADRLRKEKGKNDQKKERELPETSLSG